jgi:hypothetical protein
MVVKASLFPTKASGLPFNVSGAPNFRVATRSTGDNGDNGGGGGHSGGGGGGGGVGGGGSLSHKAGAGVTAANSFPVVGCAQPSTYGIRAIVSH